MSEPLRTLYNNLIATGKADEKRLGSYQEFENEAKTNQFDLYQNLSAYGFKEEEIGSWRDFSGLINRKLISGREPNITPYASETETFRDTSKIKDNTALRPNYPAVPTKQDTPAEVVGGQEVQVGGQDNELDIKKTPKVENPDAPFKYRTADTVFVVDPSSRKAYDMSGNPAPDAILSEALESRIDPIKQTKDSQMPTQELLNRNDRTWLEAQIRDKSEQVRALRDKGRAGVEGAVGAPYYASQAAVQTNLSEIEPIEAELTDLQRQYAKLEYNDINNGVHKRLFSEFEKTPEYKALQSRYEKLISTVPITISDEARQDFNAKYGGEIETLQAQLTQKSMEEFSKSQELAGLQAKYQKDMDEFVRANRSKPIFDSMYREKVKAVTAEIEREQVKLFNQLYGQQIDKEVSELSNNKFMEYMKANPDKFQDYNNKVQNYINNFNELAGADFQKAYGKEFQAEVGKAMLEKIRSTDFLKDDFTTTSTEFILRGFDDSVLGGIVGRLSGVNRSDQQIEDYYNPTMIEGAARGALSIVVDTPLFAIPGAGGAAIAARGTSIFARRAILNLVAKGTPLKVAEQAVMAAWKTRFATTTGIGGSMGALGGYDQIRDLYTQSFDDSPGIDMKQNLKATGKGLVLGFGIGWIGMGSRVMNNYINKSLDNVFASHVVRKGVEQTARAGVNLSALTVENAAFVYGGSFLEGREATPEEFGEGMVLLGFLKAKGYFSNVAKAIPVKDKPQIDFTREELGYLLKPNNKEAWKRINEMGELEMKAVFEDPNAPLTMKMKIAASRGVTVDDTFINTDGAKAVVVSDNGKFYVEYRSKEGELLQKAEFSTAEQATTQAMTLEALTVAKEAMTKYDKLGATEKAKVNAEMKPEEKAAVAEVVDGKVTEEGLIAAAKLNETVDRVAPKEEVNAEAKPISEIESTSNTLQQIRRDNQGRNSKEEIAKYDELYALFEFVKGEERAKGKDSTSFTDLSEYYHKAKKDGNNPEFVRAVEKVIGTSKQEVAPKEEVKPEEVKPAEVKPVEAEVKPVEEVKPEVKTVEAVAPEVKAEPTEKLREEISDIDAAINELRQNNPKEFKKDGTLKADSKLSSTLKSLVDRQNKLIEEFPERSAADKEKSRIQTEEINRQFEERQAQLAESTKTTKEEMLEASIDDKLRFRNELSKEEIDYANENYFVPKGFRFGKFGLEPSKSEPIAETSLGQSVQEGVQAKPAPTAEVGKESVQVDVEAKRKALDDSINTDGAKKIADKIREGKIDNDIMMSGIPFAKEVWNGAVEAIARAVEAGGEIAKAFRIGLDYVKNSDWYKSLKQTDREAAEQRFNSYFNNVKEKTLNVGVAARDISRREVTKVLVDEFKALKDQIKLESKSAKQAATFIAKFLDANKKEIAAVGLTVRDTTRIQKVAVKSEKSAIDLMDKMINDAGYRKALKDAEASQKQIKRAIAYGEFNLSKVEKETLNKVATIDLDGHFFSREFLDSYNAMKKQVFENRRVPSPEAIGKFYSLYEQDIIDNHVRKELAQEVDAKTVDTVVKRIDSLYEQLQEWNTDPTKIDRKEIALAKGRLSYLLTKANNFIKNGVFEVDNQKVKDLDSRLAELENFINNDAEPINKAIEGIESSYKNTEVRNLDLRPVSSVNLKLRGVNKYAAETATRLRRALKTARDSKVSDKLSLNDIENIKAVLSGIDSGYIPKITTKIIEKIETADLVNKSGNEIVSAIKNNILSNKIIRKRLAKYPTTQSLARVLDKWDKADIDKMLNLETKRKGKPIEELITGALEQPLFKSNQELDKVLRPVREARAKALAAKFWNPVEYFRNKSKAETYDNMIGIALRSLNHIANLPTTLKKAEVNGEYEIVLQDGKRYEEGGSPKKFATIEDANNFIRDNVEKFFTADELDFYHTVNFGKFKTQRANAKLSENALITEREIEKFDKAYEALKKLTGTDRVYFKTFDELTSKLPAKLKPYIEAMRDALESSKDIASEVATREGVNFVHNDSYWPYPNKELNVGRQGKTDIQDFASTMKAENVKSGNIYERTQSVHYTDFNARRVFEGYMRTMLTDYYMNPESRVVLGALREVSRGLGKEYRRDGELSAETKIVVDALEQLIKDRFIAHLSSHQLFDGMVFGKKVGGSTYIFDVGKLGRDILGFGRSVALVSAARRVIPEPVSNISKILGGFIRKGDKFNPLRISDKAEALLPVLEDVSGSVRSLSSQRFQKGNYDQFELQQDRNAIREFSEKYILQLGDMLTMRPLWVTKFETRFKELTGKEIDPAEWQRNEEYKDSNYDAVIRSMRYADSVIEEVFPAQTKFGRAQTGAFGIRTASDVGALNMIMNSFGVRESSTFVLALNDFRYGTNLGRADAAGRLAGLTAANFIWLASGQMVYSGTKYLFGLINDDEAAKEKALEAWRNAFSAEGITTNIVANVALLLTGRYANAGRLIAGITAGFAIDKILDAEPDPIERANMRASIKQGLAQLRTIGMTVPESETDRINMLFPIIAQSMSELGMDAANVGTYVVDLGKKVADGTASEDDIQLWTLLKATHDMMILKGYTHPFTKEMNMYLREKSRGELKSVETYTSSIKQLYKGAEYKPEKADEVAQKVKLLYENFKKKSIDESNSFEAMWGAMSATENVLENLESLKNKEASDAMKIRRLPYPERYRYLQDKYPDNRGEWSPYVTKGFSRYLYIKDSYETGSVEDRDKMFDLE